MVMYFFVGLLIMGIGVYDAVNFEYENNHFGFKHPILIRYTIPALWVVAGIMMFLTGFHV